jgi:DNA mismatch repair ATPase MutS
LAAGGNAKEGFSLLSLLDHRTKSRAGRQRLREWMLQPSLSIQEIVQRQDGVELFMQPEIQPFAGTIQKYLERMGGSVDKILARIQKCCAKPNDFLMLANAISSAVAIIDTIQEDILSNILLLQCTPHPEEEQGEHKNDVPQKYVTFVTRLLERCHVEAIQKLFVRITVLIDEEATNECKTIVIRPGEHAELDAMKQQFERLEGKSRWLSPPPRCYFQRVRAPYGYLSVTNLQKRSSLSDLCSVTVIHTFEIYWKFFSFHKWVS